MSDIVKRLRERKMFFRMENDPHWYLSADDFDDDCRRAADEIERLTTALENARKDALEEAAIAAGQACWKHSGDDTYSKGMDAGAIHQTRACVEAIRSLTPPKEKAT